MESETTLLLHKVEFKRIILHMWGEVITTKKTMPQLEFWNEMTGQRTLPQHVEWDGNRFYLRMNVLSVNHEEPMENGNYYLAAYEGKKRLADATFAKDYAPEVNEERDNPLNVVIYRNAGHYFRGYSDVDLDTGAYYLQVRVAIPKPRVFFVKKAFIKFKNNLRHNLWEITHWCSLRVFAHYSKHAKYKGDRILFASGSRAEIGGNEQFVYVVDSENLAHRVVIETGLNNAGSTEVTGGLKGGETLVTSGQAYLTEGCTVRVVG